MQLRLLSVGKPKDLALVEIHDRYSQRLIRLGLAYLADYSPEIATGGRYSDEHVRDREAEALLGRLSGPGTVIALDPGGSSFSSEDLASQIERWVRPCATFVVGGPRGLGASILDRAEICWSLSPLTFPHELVRVLVAEQLYRAWTLARGLPYHR